MRIAVHQEPTGHGLGGADLVVAVAAAELAADGHAVELVHHRPGGYLDRLAAFCGVPLPGVTERFVPKRPAAWQNLSGPAWRLGRALRAYDADLSRGYDLFLTSQHGLPPYNHAAAGAFYLHFPTAGRVGAWPWAGGTGVKDRVRRAVYERLWWRCLATYGGRLANSEFTAGWADRRWGVACDVLYPPVLPAAEPGAKRDMILTLGRFCPMKRQLDAVRTFAGLSLPGWELWCVGGLGDADRDYFAEVQAAATATPGVRLMPNAGRDELAAALAGAKVFWHLAGLGVDADAEPEKLEHFGIATVEAMAAGCVPVTLDRGGQKEIVEHGHSGFLAASVADIGEATAELAADDAARGRMAAAARERATAFGRERFAAGLRAVVDRVCGAGAVTKEVSHG